jgi:glycosyltransferase involved in cell wall biosynthesis
VSVTPSVFPEAFGLVAAEAASCGSPPLVARQSGLAEVANALESEYPDGDRQLAGFSPGDVDDLTAKLDALLSLPRDRWIQLSRAARRAALRYWSWAATSELLLNL